VVYNARRTIKRRMMNTTRAMPHFRLVFRKKTIFITTPPYINGMQGGAVLDRIFKIGTIPSRNLPSILPLIIPSIIP
jgi:hypothetical protein